MVWRFIIKNSYDSFQNESKEGIRGNEVLLV